MKNKNSFAIVAFLFATTPSFAADRVTQIQENSPSLTPFEVLKQLYDESKTPAKLTDFDLNTEENGNQNCRAYSNSKHKLYELNIFRVKYTKEGTQSAGPLFPGTKDTIMTTLFIQAATRVEVVENSKNATISNLQDGIISHSATDLIFTASDVSAAHESPLIVNMRENSNLIAIKGKSKAGTPEEVITYAYCYRE